MTAESTPRVALVTGGSRGIGRAIVEALLAERWQVFFCARTAKSAAEALDQLHGRFKGQVFALQCDVAQQDQVEQLLGWVVDAAHRLDCLVNNTGIGLFAPIDEISGEDWRRVLETNLDGPFFTIRAAAPLMKRQGFGWIINIASLAGRNAFAGGVAYNASKFGLMGLSEAAMLDLRPHGIRVVSILPGSVRTEFSHSKPGARDDWKLLPQDIARIVLDLLRFPERALPSLIEIRPARLGSGS